MFAKVCFALAMICFAFFWLPFVNLILIPTGIILMIPTGWVLLRRASESRSEVASGNSVPTPLFVSAPLPPSVPTDKRQDAPREPVTRPPSPPEPEKTISRVYTYEAPGIPICLRCGTRPAIFRCLRHEVTMCLQCVGAHDRPQECSYRPNWRVVSLSSVQEQTPGLAGGAHKRKTGDVFGIG